jgi:ABC-2 type transport system permease protein
LCPLLFDFHCSSAILACDMRAFCVQLGWEFYRLGLRPRSWIPFGAVLLFELAVSAALRVAGVRAAIARDLWKMHWRFEENFSGLTTATHILGEAATLLGGFGIALVASDIVAKESEDGTLRMLLARPVTRRRIFTQKLIATTVYSLVLTGFTAATALGIGLLFEGRGPLLMIALHENIIGAFDFAPGVRRYGIATALLLLTQLSGMVVPFAFSCFSIRPNTAFVFALTMLLADTSIRLAPGFGSVGPFCMTTRLLSWRQAFNEEIPWTRIERNYAILAGWDLAWLATGFAVFRRRDVR